MPWFCNNFCNMWDLKMCDFHFRCSIDETSSQLLNSYTHQIRNLISLLVEHSQDSGDSLAVGCKHSWLWRRAYIPKKALWIVCAGVDSSSAVLIRINEYEGIVMLIVGGRVALKAPQTLRPMQLGRTWHKAVEFWWDKALGLLWSYHLSVETV